MRCAAEAAFAGLLGAVAAYGTTYAVKHYVPGLWFLWLASGGVIAWALSRWKSRYWLVIGLATPSLVLAELFWKVKDDSSTAAALGLGFGLFWAILSLAGAALSCRSSGPST